MAKPPGLRKRGGSWEIRKRVPDRLRTELPTEIVKSFGGVSTKEAYRLGWLELARIEQRFEAAEIRLGLSKSSTILSDPPPQTLSDNELVNIARRFLGELEETSPPIFSRMGKRLPPVINIDHVEKKVSIGSPCF